MDRNRGVTLISLVITIIVLIIIATITVHSGINIIEKAAVEELKTNMLLIEAKTSESIENANFKLGTKIDEKSEEEKQNRINNAKAELKGTEIEKPNNIPHKEGSYIYYYKLSEEQLKEIGLTDVKSNNKNGEYIIEYNVENVEIEIYHTKGYNGKYSLTEIEQIEE